MQDYVWDDRITGIKMFESTCRDAKVGGKYISLNGFAKPGIEYAKKKKIELIDFGELCRRGESHRPRLYYFGSKKPTMMGETDLVTVCILNSGGTKSTLQFTVDGIEKPVILRCAEKCFLSMFKGDHVLRFKMNDQTFEKKININKDIRFSFSRAASARM